MVDLLAGYGTDCCTPGASFAFRSFPLVRAWSYLHHTLAGTCMDNTAVDIFWFRSFHATHGWSLAPFVLLLILSWWLVRRAAADLGIVYPQAHIYYPADKA